MIWYLNSSRVSWYSFRLKTKALGKVKKQQNFSKYKFFTLSTAGMNLLYWFRLVYSAGPKWHKCSSMYWPLPGKCPNTDQKKLCIWSLFMKWKICEFVNFKKALCISWETLEIEVARCSENLQQIYRRTPMPQFHFNKVTS